MNAGKNIAPPEPVILLELAREVMHEYRQEYGLFPKEWYNLEIAFVGGPTYAYRIGDPGTYPMPENGNSWQPKDCVYRYVIESATANTFRIIAVSPDGNIAYELTEKMDSPEKLLAPNEDEETPRKLTK